MDWAEAMEQSDDIWLYAKITRFDKLPEGTLGVKAFVQAGDVKAFTPAGPEDSVPFVVTAK